jgi:hypothetical protein
MTKITIDESGYNNETIIGFADEENVTELSIEIPSKLTALEPSFYVVEFSMNDGEVFDETPELQPTEDGRLEFELGSNFMVAGAGLLQIVATVSGEAGKKGRSEFISVVVNPSLRDNSPDGYRANLRTLFCATLEDRPETALEGQHCIVGYYDRVSTSIKAPYDSEYNGEPTTILADVSRKYYINPFVKVFSWDFTRALNRVYLYKTVMSESNENFQELVAIMMAIDFEGDEQAMGLVVLNLEGDALFVNVPFSSAPEAEGFADVLGKWNIVIDIEIENVQLEPITAPVFDSDINVLFVSDESGGPIEDGPWYDFVRNIFNTRPFLDVEFVMHNGQWCERGEF